jgi:nucleotide-binding universal stress UspA family protein
MTPTCAIPFNSGVAAMSYKSIAVHLDTSERAQARLELALRIASRYNAHLTGVFSVYIPDPRVLFVMAGTAMYYADHEAVRLERRAAIERLFRAEAARANVTADWISVDDYASIAVPRIARCADLIVAGQYDPDDPESYVGDHFPEDLVMSSGRPVLFVPYAGNFAGNFAAPGARVTVAWDGSREATRAVHDALPFLKQATLTTVVTVNGAKGEAPDSRIPGADIAAVIARHGVKVETRNITVSNDTSTGNALLSHVADDGSDLLVMGAYGHARWQELLMGGASQSLLKSMTVPTLMSH